MILMEKWRTEKSAKLLYHVVILEIVTSEVRVTSRVKSDLLLFNITCTSTAPGFLISSPAGCRILCIGRRSASACPPIWIMRASSTVASLHIGILLNVCTNCVWKFNSVLFSFRCCLVRVVRYLAVRICLLTSVNLRNDEVGVYGLLLKCYSNRLRLLAWALSE